MTDHLTPKKRSWHMSQIRSKNTKPELMVRKALHKLGFRFRLHKKELPGTPDIYLKKLNLVIFVHGCFWHNHNCNISKIPKSNTEYWLKKLKSNKKRDKIHYKDLKLKKYNVLIIWECEIKKNIKNFDNYINDVMNKIK